MTDEFGYEKVSSRPRLRVEGAPRSKRDFFREKMQAAKEFSKKKMDAVFFDLPGGCRIDLDDLRPCKK